MYFKKIHHPCNFVFATSFVSGKLAVGKTRLRASLTDFGGSLFRLRVEDRRWGANLSQATLSPESAGKDASPMFTASINRSGLLSIADASGQSVLAGLDSGTFGTCGQAWMMQFRYDESLRFYGFGEKISKNLEKTGLLTKFWNTDVMADFSPDEIQNARTDPAYVSIPYIAVKTAGAWVGILINNPFASFACAGATFGENTAPDAKPPKRFYIGADDGMPEVWFVLADSLAGLTRRYQRLVGVTPLPPLWALGHHQCRWGYESAADLAYVKDQMARHDIPNSGLWLDIDYMDGFRVFTWNRNHFPAPAKDIARLQADGQRVVPILDPGVKDEKGFEVADRGRKANAFCLTPEGEPYNGFVWPGTTLFPDFSTEKGRNWWAGEARRFASNGIEGAWLDMNDPSVGAAELDPMRFDGGRLPHAAFHNQYGAGMARASYEGFIAAHPDKRPFFLCRSGFVGSQRHTAIWTGDNMSNDAYLSASIPCVLNLALSGVPLCGPDVPGFAGDADEWLALRWYQLGFLFPVLRNHCCKGNRAQEPWTYDKSVRTAIAHLIRLRYRLMPYLYNLWMNQEERGDAVLRPLLYDFAGTPELPFDRVNDQFMVGPAIMQAPITHSDRHNCVRDVALPEGDWYDLRKGEWTTGGRTVRAEMDRFQTPAYARAGTIVPALPADPNSHAIDTADVDMHCFIRDGQTATLCYRADDGESFAYRKGRRSSVSVTATLDGDTAHVTVKAGSRTWKPLKLRIVLYAPARRLIVNGKPARLTKFAWKATGANLHCLRSPTIPSEISPEVSPQ